MNYSYNPSAMPVKSDSKSVSVCGVIGFILAVLTFAFYIIGSVAEETGFFAIFDYIDLGFDAFAPSLLMLLSTIALFATSFSAIKGNTAIPAIAGVFYFASILFNQLYILDFDIMEYIFEYSVGQALLLFGLAFAFALGVGFLFGAKNVGCKIVSAIMFAVVLVVPLLVKDNFFGPHITQIGIVNNWWSQEFDFGCFIYQLSVCVLPYASLLMIALGGKKGEVSQPQTAFVPQTQWNPYGSPQGQFNGMPQPQQNPYAAEQGATYAQGVPNEASAPEAVEQRAEVFADSPVSAPTVVLSEQTLAGDSMRGEEANVSKPAAEFAEEPAAEPVVEEKPQVVMTEEKAAQLRVLFAKKSSGEITEEQFKALRNELFKN